MRTIHLVPLALLAAVSVPAIAGKAKHTRFVGVHPVPKAEGGGFCYIEGPHVHVFGANKLEYRDHRDANYFVGDPVAYGYDGPRHAYKGHHPIHVHEAVGDDDRDVEFCYLDGPHFHAFVPPAEVEAEFKVAGDAYFYVGEPPPMYVEARPAMVKINAVYTPLVYTRPVIAVEPPSAWIGLRVGVPAAAVVVDSHPGAVVVAPAARVRAGVSVDVHIPPPPTISVGVGIGIGGGVLIDGGHHHHDRGKHKGWHKGKRR